MIFHQFFHIPKSDQCALTVAMEPGHVGFPGKWRCGSQSIRLSGAAKSFVLSRELQKGTNMDDVERAEWALRRWRIRQRDYYTRSVGTAEK